MVAKLAPRASSAELARRHGVPEPDLEAEVVSVGERPRLGLGARAESAVADAGGRDLPAREIEQRDQLDDRPLQDRRRLGAGGEAIDEGESQERVVLGPLRAQAKLVEPRERGAHDDCDHDEHDQRNHVAGGMHREGVQWFGEVVVERAERHHCGGDARHVAEHRRAHHHEQEHGGRDREIGARRHQQRGGDHHEREPERDPRGRRNDTGATPTRDAPLVQQPDQSRRPEHAAGW